MKKMIAEIKQAGATFRIPVQVDDIGEIFITDVQPVNQEEDEDNDAARRWFYHQQEMQLLNDENNFPSKYK